MYHRLPLRGKTVASETVGLTEASRSPRLRYSAPGCWVASFEAGGAGGSPGHITAMLMAIKKTTTPTIGSQMGVFVDSCSNFVNCWSIRPSSPGLSGPFLAILSCQGIDSECYNNPQMLPVPSENPHQRCNAGRQRHGSDKKYRDFGSSGSTSFFLRQRHKKLQTFPNPIRSRPPTGRHSRPGLRATAAGHLIPYPPLRGTSNGRAETLAGRWPLRPSPVPSQVRRLAVHRLRPEPCEPLATEPTRADRLPPAHRTPFWYCRGGLRHGPEAVDAWPGDRRPGRSSFRRDH